jgi:hypothetical protein
MIAEMKGQDRSMFFMVDKVCKRRFKVEVSVPTDGVQVDFTMKVATPFITVTSKEYDVTRLEVRFVVKKCDEVKDSDWGPFQEVAVVNGTAIGPPVNIQIVIGEASAV